MAHASRFREHPPRTPLVAGFALLAVALAAPPGPAGATTPIGTERQVNQAIAGPQRLPAVAVSPAGTFVVTWTDDGEASPPAPGRLTPTSAMSEQIPIIKGRALYASGAPASDEFAFERLTSIPSRSAISSAASGSFIVGWAGTLLLQGGAVFAQRLGPDGLPGGSPPFRISSLTHVTGDLTIAAAPSGAFMAAWSGTLVSQGTTLHARFFDSSNQPLTDQYSFDGVTRINERPAVAAGPGGEYVITWSSTDNATGEQSIRGTRFDGTGHEVGTEFQVNAGTLQLRGGPCLTIIGQNFAVAWSNGAAAPESPVRLRLFSLDGTPQTDEVPVCDDCGPSVSNTAIARSGSSYFVTWAEDLADGPRLRGREVSSSGVPVGAAFEVSSVPGGSQSSPAIGGNAAGDVLVTWESENLGCPPAVCGKPASLTGETPSDTSDSSIHAQQFGPSPVPVDLASLRVSRTAAGAALQWDVLEEATVAGFHVHRDVTGTRRERLTLSPLSGRTHYEFVDVSAPISEASYWLEEIGRNGSTRWHGPIVLVPAAATPAIALLAPVSPNPARGAATIRISLPSETSVSLRVFDALGRPVTTLAEGLVPAGDHAYTWNGTTDAGGRASFGLYVVKLETSGAVQTRKVVLAP